MYLALGFMSLVMFVAPSPGWYMWVYPFIVYCFIRYPDFPRFAIISVNGFYLLYFLLSTKYSLFNTFEIFNGIETIIKTKHIWGIIISTSLIWGCYYLMTIWLLESCGIYLTLSGSFVMLLMGAIIIAVPALPGGLGTYEAGITFTLMLLFFVTKDEALTYAIVSHASNYMPYLVIGSIYFINSGLKISDIKKESD